jgi:DNA-directed RNA polymerase specialized sigma24 family protein
MREDQQGSVTRWIGHLKEADPQAAHHLWDRYFHRLVALARAKLGQTPTGAANEEDAALSAFYNLCDGAAQGRFDRLESRDDLWQLLVVITTRKAVDLKKRQRRLKRGGGRVVVGSDVGNGPDEGHDGLAQVAATGPTPELAAMLAEEYQRRLHNLGDDSLRRVAQLRLDGHTNDEIAELLGCARRTVARKLEAIRAAWEIGATA